MKLTQKGKVFLLAAITSLAIPFLSITRSGFASFGLGISLILLSSLIYLFKENKGTKTKLYYFLSLLFSAFIFIRSEASITFINFLATLFFGSLMVFPKKAQNLFDLIFSPFATIIKSLATKNIYQLEYEKTEKVKGKSKVFDVVMGVAVTILILSVVLPLLASANPIFNGILNNLIKNLDLQNLLKWFSMENLFINLVRLSFSLFFVILIPKMMTASNNKSGDNSQFDLKINLIIPKVAVALVLIVFFVTQIQLYFSTSETLTQMGYSYSQYTREVFGQLSIVSLIIFLLVYLDKSSNKFNKLINYILLTQTGFLTLMAFKSDFEYSQKWGFTYLRLYGFAVVVWTLGALLIFINAIKNHNKKSFIPKTVIWIGVVLLGINLSNFDYLIYHFRKASTGQGIDYHYLSRLSPDSLSFKEQLDEQFALVPDNIDTKEKADTYFKTSMGNQNLLYKIRRLKEKYKKLDFRTFNLFEYLQYLKVKNIEIEKYEGKLNLPIPSQFFN